ncbi:MAG TPA: AAA family ATPase [Steroidobacter sp.]
MADLELLEQRNAIALTKFRAPRLKRDIVVRPALLEALAEAIDSHPVTLVCAPGGAGKTILLAQLAASNVRNSRVLWVTVEHDDNDPCRFFASLVRAVEPLKLSWEVAPRALVESVASSKAHARAALAALVNALCTTQLPRVVLILDDLHRLDKPEVLELLDSLIERLPDHVAVVLGSRVEPALSLARWRAYGELATFDAKALEFTEADAVALSLARFGRALDHKVLNEALKRSHGWAAGLSLLLDSRASASTECGRGVSHRVGPTPFQLSGAGSAGGPARGATSPTFWTSSTAIRGARRRTSFVGSAGIERSGRGES